MKVLTYDRSRLHGRVWPVFEGRNGHAPLRDETWRRWLNLSGIGINVGQRSYWLLVRRGRR